MAKIYVTTGLNLKIQTAGATVASWTQNIASI